VQIFLDTTGRRSKIVNWLISIGLIYLIVLLAFIAVYTVRLQAIERSARLQSPQQNVAQENQVAMLYTDNHAEAYPILREQINSLDTLITPTYLVTDNAVTQPENYRVLHDDIEFLTRTQAAEYKHYHHLSTMNYNQLPLDRSTNSSALIAYPDILNLGEISLIRDTLVKSGAHGLIVELDARIIDNAAATARMVRWLESVRNIMHEHNLKLGIHLKLDGVNERATELVRDSDVVYLSFSQTDRLESQLQKVAAIKDYLPNNTILEIPSVSSKVNLLNRYDYVENIDYSSITPLLQNKLLEKRTFESAKIDSLGYRYQVFDAVSAYNVMKSVSAQANSDNIKFSIGSPGYEEYTIWSLLKNSTQQTKQREIITTKVMNNRGIEQLGAGEIYELSQAGSFGSRTIEVNDESQMITSSVMEKDNSPAIISRSGHKPKTVALTFDDGPHPVYTSKIMDVLEDHGIKGTFFVVGEKVASYPDVARDIVRRGHEIENHTYLHTAISKVDREKAVAEIMATSDIIEFITGESAKYFRRPYSDSTSVNSQADIAYLQLLDNLGLQASEYDIDSKDWQLTSADDIFKKVKKDIAELPNGSYSQVLLHDSHDNPELTLQALPLIIEYFKSKGVSLVRVDELAKVATNESRVIKDTTAYMALSLKNIFIRGFVLLNLVFISFAVTKYIWMVIGSFVYLLLRKKRGSSQHHRRKRRRRPTLAVIIACYNEEKVIGMTIESLLMSTYKKFRIIVINDGSTDNTKKVVEKYVKLDSRVELISTHNQGKAHALQLGIAHVKNKWLVFCDADTIFAPNALKEYSKTVNSSTNLGAVAGRIRVGNDINFLTRAQVIEYSVAHTFIKPAQDILNTVTVVPGACGLWNRKKLIAAGGFPSDTLAEDADATINIVSYGGRVSYENGILADTEAPLNMVSLYKQRTRWQLGNMQALFKHHRGVFNRRYGALGYIGLPMFYIEILHVLFFPILLVFAAVNLLIVILQIETILPTNVSFMSSQAFLSISLSVIVLDILLSVFVIVREPKSWKQKTQLLATLPYYYLFYRFFLSYSTFVALLRALRGRLHGWDHLKRSATVKQSPVLITS
jgi:peptidoglycan-N-acetylglucosamine deacetylase